MTFPTCATAGALKVRPEECGEKSAKARDRLTDPDRNSCWEQQEKGEADWVIDE